MQNSDSKPFSDLPPYLTVGEIVVEVGNVARENLAKITPPHSKTQPETKE